MNTPNTVVPVPDKIKRAANPLVMQMVLRNHVMGSVNDICTALIEARFPSGSAPSNWSTIVAKASSVRVSAATFAQNYMTFTSQRPSEIVSKLEAMKTSIEGLISKVRSGGDSAAIKAELTQIESVLTGSDMVLPNVYQNLQTEWEAVIAGVQEMESLLPAVTEKYTHLLNEFKTAMIGYNTQVEQAMRDRNFFDNAWHIVDLVISPFGTLLKGYMAMLGDSVTQLHDLADLRDAMEDVGENLGGMEPAEITILKQTGQLKSAMYIATRIGAEYPGDNMIELLEADREQLLSDIRSCVDENGIIVELGLKTALQDLEYYKQDASWCIFDISFNNALVKAGMTSAEVKAAMDKAHSTSIVDYWNNIGRHAQGLG